MSETQQQISIWPTKDLMTQGVGILEEFAHAHYELCALPPECLDPSWRLPDSVYGQLEAWASRGLPVAVIGFPQKPELCMLGWLLYAAGLGKISLPELRLGRPEYSRLFKEGQLLLNARVFIEPGPAQSAGGFYSRMIRTVLESGARAVIACAGLGDGSDLRFEAQPFGLLQRLGIQEDNLIVVDGS